MNAYLAGLKLLARRELSIEGLRIRLRDRAYPESEISEAIERLLETGALDDGRVARAYARTAATVKGRGRLRVTRELQAMGIDRQVAAEAVDEAYAEFDERALIARAVQKKLRGRRKLKDVAERARVYQHLIRQGFSPGAIAEMMKSFIADP
jgi:SOS response regulatory protein OraA/RecX